MFGKKFNSIWLVFMPLIIFSCNNNLTKEEITIIKKYTEQEEHKSLILGKWIENEGRVENNHVIKSAISFDKKGIVEERMYRNGKPFNDWHFIDYYYAKQGKIFMYRPAEKGFLAMDDEIFTESDYQISNDGEILRLKDKSYKKFK